MITRGRIAVLIVAVCALALTLLIIARPQKPTVGFTYSAPYAQSLGLDPIQSFNEILNQLPFQFVRLPVYWDRYEPLNDLWDTGEINQLLDIAEHHNVKVILAIGQKVPRWPECYAPNWTSSLTEPEYDQQFTEFIEHIVKQSTDRTIIARWQVENESYFPFGDCEQVEPKLIRAQTKIVNQMGGNRPIQTTVSGEQGVGFSKAAFADIVGMSLYRSVKAPVLGDYQFPHTPFFYRVQSWLITLAGKRAVISELQAEPWGLHEFDLSNSVGVAEAYQAFTKEDLAKQMEFARRTGVREISLWGVEWWLALAHRGEGALFEGAKDILRNL